MRIEEKKQMVAEAAMTYVEAGMKIGIGTGSTANLFIDVLANAGMPLGTAIASSIASFERLKKYGFSVRELKVGEKIPVYIDGADEANQRLELIKGGGGALLKEKILATASRQFVCLIHDTKLVERLGAFPLPVEVAPNTQEQVAKALRELGGEPLEREGFVTDNGNIILDVHNLMIGNPAEMELELNKIPGVLDNGIFACRRADILLIGTDSGIRTLS